MAPKTGDNFRLIDEQKPMAFARDQAIKNKDEQWLSRDHCFSSLNGLIEGARGLPEEYT